MKSAIAIFSPFAGTPYTTCHYLKTKRQEKKTQCFYTPVNQVHFWITENGVPPTDGTRCVCSKEQYYSSYSGEIEVLES